MRRFARQLVLEQVGPEGQKKLIHGCVRIIGEGLALETAATYLARGGTRLNTAGFSGGVHGFGWNPADVVLHRPDTALLSPAGTAAAWAHASFPSESNGPGVIGSAPDAFTGAAPWVALGTRQGKWQLLARQLDGCADCFLRAVRGLEVGPFGPQAVRFGALAAWKYQRALLGLDAALSGQVQTDDGAEAFISFTDWRCDRHP